MKRICLWLRKIIEHHPVAAFCLVGLLTLPGVVQVSRWQVAHWRDDRTGEAIAETGALLRQRTAHATERALLEFDKIQSHVNLLAKDARIVDFAARVTRAAQPEISAYLEAFTATLKLDAAYIIDREGFCIASSLVNGTSLIGTDYRDRQYFSEALAGRHATQFVVGRVSKVPGFHFAAPILKDGAIIGVATAKIDIVTFSEYLHLSWGYVTDDNGVIVLSDSPDNLLRVTPEASALTMPAKALHTVYLRDTFDTLDIPRETIGHTPVYLFGQPPKPCLVRIQPFPQEKLTLHLYQPVEGLAAINSQYALRLYLTTTALYFSLLATLAIVIYAIRDSFLKRQLIFLNQELQKQAQHDSLTECYNRRKFDELFRDTLDALAASGQPMAVAIIDLDDFKEKNDTFGHTVGDKVLVHVASILRCGIRGDDVLARYGGEEFVVILPRTDEAQAGCILERLRARVMDSPMLADGRIIRQTISAGIVATDSPQAPHELLHEADKALYVAKNTGKNRVVRHSTIDGSLDIADLGGPPPDQCPPT